MTTTEDIQVRRAAVGDESTLRDLRLRAMRESPAAFGSTYESELARTTADWQRWLSPGVTFLLESRGVPAGLVAAARDLTESTVINLMAMWLDPSLRGTGSAERLVAAVTVWAAEEHADVIRLDVMKTNERAQRFYRRCGFTTIGQASVVENDGRPQIRMERAVTR